MYLLSDYSHIHYAQDVKLGHIYIALLVYSPHGVCVRNLNAMAMCWNFMILLRIFQLSVLQQNYVSVYNKLQLFVGKKDKNSSFNNNDRLVHWNQSIKPLMHVDF